MPVSSTFSTSAPMSANSSVQNPPGKSRVRSSTRRPLSGSDTRLHSEQSPGLFDRGGTPAGVLAHLPRLRDQLAVRARHLAVREIEVVLEADSDRAAERERGRNEHPLLARDADDAPVRPLGHLGCHRGEVARCRAHAAYDTHDAVDVQRWLEHAHVDQWIERADVSEVEALVLR